MTERTSTTPSKHSTTLPSLLGLWTGTFNMLSPHGTASGATEYEFTEQTGNLLKAENRWRVEAMPGQKSNEPLPQGVNAILGAIAEDGVIHLVSNNDTAVRRMRLTSENTIDFVEFAGGEQQWVVSVKLSRASSD